MEQRQTVAVDLAEVRALAGYIADLEDDGDVASERECEGAWEVIDRLGLSPVVLDAIADVYDEIG